MNNNKIMNIDSTISKAIEDIISRQRNGSWAGDIYFHTYLTAAIAIINKVMGVEDKDWENRAVKVIEENQRADGSWGLLDEKEFNHPAIAEPEAEKSIEIRTGIARNTVICLRALKILGGSEKSIEKAQEYIDKRIDMRDVDEITKLLISYFGDTNIKTINIPSVEVILIPRFFKQSVERTIPVWCVNSVISALLLKAIESGDFNWSPIRRLAINKAKRILINNQLPNGSWYNVTDPTMHSTLALYRSGYTKDNQVIRNGLNFLNGQRNMRTGYVHRYWLHIWDTALTLIALEYAGLTKDHPAISKARSYLMDSVSEKGTWGFCPVGRTIPDCDDTAMVTIALRNLGLGKEIFEPGVHWLFDMQNSDGGWAAHTKDQTKSRRCEPTLEDPTLLLRDPSSADITGHVLCALGRMDYKIDHPKIQRATEFLKQDQLECGAWYGRWGMCYTYGTSRALWGLNSVGEDMSSEYVQRAANWLIDHQNDDGGWGEHYMSYYREDLAGIGASTPIQTGWALVGLLSLQDLPINYINKGVNYLINTQLSSGGWIADTHSVAALEINMDTNYDIWSLMALGLYKKRMNTVLQKLDEPRERLVVVESC